MTEAPTSATIAPRRRWVRPHAWLGFGAGLLVALSLPPWGWWPLAFVGIALFEVSMGAEPSRRERAARAWLFGAGWMFPGLAWMWFLTAPGYIVAGAIFAGFHAAAAVLAPTGRWRTIGRPAAHTLAEALRLVFPFGGVPLASIAIGQAAGPFVGVARVGGVLLLTWVVFQIATSIVGPAPFVPHLAHARSRVRGERPDSARPQPAWHGVAGLGVAVAVVVVAAIAPSGHDIGRAVRIAIVQGGGAQGTHAIHSDPRIVMERHLAATRTIEPGSVDVVLWPENVIDVPTFAGSTELAEVTAEAKRIGAPLVVGITEDVAASTAGGTQRFLNAQVVVTPAGDVISRYDKVHRVPFGEYVPLRGLLEALGAPVDQVPKDAVAGTGPAVLDLQDGTRFGVVISFEVFFGERARDGARRGAELIINPTNGSSYTGTVLQTQQVASSILRATETGRWVAQAAPTGFSAFVSPDGDVIDRTAQREQRVIVHDVPLRTGTTWYTSLGDLPFVFLAALALAVSVAASGGLPGRIRSGSWRRVEPPG